MEHVSSYPGKEEPDELIVEIVVQDDARLQKAITADVNTLVILTARAKVDEEIYFLKLGKEKVPSMISSSESFELHYPSSVKLILCATLCDTTLMLNNKG